MISRGTLCTEKRCIPYIGELEKNTLCVEMRTQAHDLIFLCVGFYYYSGMTRPTDYETIVVEEIAYYTHRFQEHTTPQGPHRKAKGQPGGTGVDRKMLEKVFIVISMGRNKQGRVNRFKIGQFE